MPAFIQPSFARGELAPGLHGRVDTAAYRIGLRAAYNVLIHATGGASNRAGLEYIGPVKNHSTGAYLIPFKFKTTDTYILEFGALYMRVIRDNSHVTETAVAITGATQTNPVVVTSIAHGYSDGDEVAISGISGMTELNGRRFLVTGATADTFGLSSQFDGTNVDGTSYAAYSSGGTVARIYELETPYALADLATLKFTQSADVMTLTHPSYQPRELSRTGHAAWTLAEIDFKPGQIYPTGLTATQNGAAGTTTYQYRVTAIADETFEESLPALNNTAATITGATQADPVVITAAAHGFANGEEVEISGIVGMTELNGRRFTVANQAANTFELEGEDGTGYTAYSSGGTANLTLVKITNGNPTLSAANNVSVTWTAAADAQRYAVYKYDNGLYGLLGETETTSFTDDGGDTPDKESSPPRVREPFRGTDKAPATVGYFEQRRIFGGANDTPDTSDYSRVGDHSNFTFSTPARADDAMRLTLNSTEVNEIRHYVPLNDLLVLTSGEEWRVDSGENNRFSTDTVRQKPQSRWGSSHLRPITIGRVVLFVQDGGALVRSIGYELAVDGYTGTDMSLLANHLFRDYTIARWALTKGQDNVIFAVRTDGIATAMTFNQEQEVIAWARIGTRSPDKFEDVATVRPSATERDEAAYFVVKRSIAGKTVRYIERLHTRRFTDVRDCFFVDCGLTYDQPITISGVTAANPLVVTATSHGLSNGDEVDISDIIWEPDVDSVSTESQPAQLNGSRYTIGSATANTFQLLDDAGDPVDGSAFNAYIEGGYARKAVLTLSGLHHLAGASVIALADGSVIRDLTVSATGTLTLPRRFSRVHVGFGYYSEIETLNIEAAAPGSGTMQGLLKNVHHVVARVERSRGLWIGPSRTELTEWKQRQNEAYGEPTALYTGGVDITISPTWGTNGAVVLRQRDPLPLTILAVVPYLEAEAVSEE